MHAPQTTFFARHNARVNVYCARFSRRVGNTPAGGRITNAAYNEQARKSNKKKRRKQTFFAI